MEQKGFCRSCKHGWQESYYERPEDERPHYRIRCNILHQVVSPKGSCKNFEALPKAPTKDEVGYDEKLCFLTNACVKFLGKPDDCEELEKLRAFRDSYMMRTQEGKILVEEYYAIAPQIVEKIDASSERETYYNYILSVINKCIKLIDEGKLEETQNCYTEMVRKLESDLLKN